MTKGAFDKALGFTIARPMRLGPVLGYLRTDNTEGGFALKQRVFVLTEDHSQNSALHLIFAVKNAEDVWNMQVRVLQPATARAASLLSNYLCTDVDLSGAGPWQVIALSVCNSISTRVVADSQLTDVIDGDQILREWLESADYAKNPCRSGAEISIDAAKACRNLESETDFSFLVGSCRYPSTVFEKGLLDLSVERYLQGQGGASALLIVGDAIYADPLVEIAIVRSEPQRWRDAYIKMFTDTAIGKLMACLPTYFVPDDHEFCNNWAADTSLLGVDQLTLGIERSVSGDD